MRRTLVALFGLVVIAAVGGCGSIPARALQMDEVTLQTRQLQSRVYGTRDEAKLLRASAGLLQDTGYQIDDSETPLGLIVASKERDATDGGQIAGAVVVALLFGAAVPVDDEQKIRVSVVTSPSGSGRTQVRATFQRIIWNTAGQVSRLEMLRDEELYTEFFDKLSKAVFLEANEI